MKLIMTGGGTGGHIYPAIAIADKIKKKHPEAEILFVGTQKGMEKDLVPMSGYEISFITVSGFHRKQILKNFKTLFDLAKGSREIRQILEEFRPDLVIGTGGYVCGPVVREAHKMGIRTFIHEANAIPGVTNKLLEKYVDRVFISYEETRKHFTQQEKLVVTGIPIRKSFYTSSLMDQRTRLGIAPTDFMVLCFGGSRGAEKINSTMLELLPRLTAEPDLQCYFITGKTHYKDTIAHLERTGLTVHPNLHVLEYASNMNELLQAADLVVSRAGALTVSEITACGKPAILIPSPNVTGNHQYFNAKVVSDKGGAVLIEEKDLSAEKLLGTMLRLKNNKEALNHMSRASRSIGRFDAVDLIYDQIFSSYHSVKDK